MFGAPSSKLPQQIGFLLVPSFSMIAFASAVEPLRLANRTSGKALYSWLLLSRDGGPVTASNGIILHPDASMESAEARHLQMLIVCSGIGGHLYEDRAVFSWLRRVERQGMDVGRALHRQPHSARAGLLDGYRCTIHWENLTGFTEEFPDIEVTSELFEIDRNRFTCSGGTAALDMMLNLIARQHGHELAAAVSDQFIHERIRDQHDHQRMALPARLGVRHPKLIAVIKLMQENLEEPLGRGDLAEKGRSLDPSARTAVRQVSEGLARPLLSGAQARPGAAAAPADQYERHRRGARLRLRLGLAFLEMLSRFLRQDSAQGAGPASHLRRRAGRRAPSGGLSQRRPASLVARRIFLSRPHPGPRPARFPCVLSASQPRRARYRGGEGDKARDF